MHLAHQHVGTESGAAKRCYGLEARFLEHGRRSVCGLISESASLPAVNWVGFDETSSFLLYGFESGFQCGTRYTASAVLFKNSKAGDAPKFLCAAFTGEPSIFATIVDPRQFLSGAVLAPSDWLSVGVDKDSVGASSLEEFSLFSAVSHASLHSRTQPLVLGQSARPVKVHAPTKVPAIVLREKSLKIRPGLPGQLFRRIGRNLKGHDSEKCPFHRSLLQPVPSGRNH